MEKIKLVNYCKAQLGAIGEHLVAVNLLAQGWDAILANMSISNVMRYDIVCVDPKTSMTKLIQVKTSVEKNIPVGFRLKNAKTVVLEEKIVGPWVFVYLEKVSACEYVPHYYVLSRSQMIRLANDSNDWYMNKWKASYRKKPVCPENVCGISVKWLKGEGEDDNDRHFAFNNPLPDTSENQWSKIWED